MKTVHFRMKPMMQEEPSDFMKTPLMNLRLRESAKPHLIFTRRLLYLDSMPLLSAQADFQYASSELSLCVAGVEVYWNADVASEFGELAFSMGYPEIIEAEFSLHVGRNPD